MMNRMRHRGTRRLRRRLALAGGLVVAFALFAGGLAFASSELITGTGSDTFSGGTGNPPTYSTDQGEVVQFNVTGDSHNVTAHQAGPDGQALFRTPTISGGSAGVQGTQFLSAGDYTFFCSVHPSTMQATLHVTGNGTPQPRPSAALIVKSKKLSKASKKGILVAITTTAKVDGVSLVAKLGKTTVGSSDGLSLNAGQSFNTIKLSKAGKSKLSKKKKASVTVTATIPFGSPASAKSKLT
jgi:plastocyanin